MHKVPNALYSPFGFNSNVYKKIETEKKYELSFIGNYSPYRRWIIDYLKAKGIQVNIFGRNWGRYGKWISQEEIVKIINQSKINLNLSNAVNYDLSFLAHSILSVRDWKELLLLKKNKEQVKGRHFEINGCGGFQLSYFVPGLNLVYEIDKEIAVYENIRSLPEEINFFLGNDDMRNSIAEKGYLRSQSDHKSTKYLENLINKVLRS